MTRHWHSRCECGNPKPPRARAGCPRCVELDYERTEGGNRRRVLAALRRIDLDWASALDVFLALDITIDDWAESRKVGSMLYQLAREGVVETQGRNSGTQYRLAQRMRRAAA